MKRHGTRGARIVAWQEHTIRGQRVELPTLDIAPETLNRIGDDAGIEFDDVTRHVLASVVARWIAYLNGFGEYGDRAVLGLRIVVSGVDATGTAGPYGLSREARERARRASRDVKKAITSLEKLEEAATPEAVHMIARHVSQQLTEADDVRPISPVQALNAVRLCLVRAARKPNGERRYAEGEFRRHLLQRVFARCKSMPKRSASKDGFIAAVNEHVLTRLNKDPKRVAPGKATKAGLATVRISVGTSSKSCQRGGSSAAIEEFDRPLATRLRKMGGIKSH